MEYPGSRQRYVERVFLSSVLCNFSVFLLHYTDSADDWTRWRDGEPIGDGDRRCRLFMDLGEPRQLAFDVQQSMYVNRV